MELLWIVLALTLQGLVVGALGRLAIPGPNPMTIGSTILVGIAGAFLGGLVGYFLLGGDRVALMLGILGAALIVWLMQRNRRLA